MAFFTRARAAVSRLLWSFDRAEGALSTIPITLRGVMARDIAVNRRSLDRIVALLGGSGCVGRDSRDDLRNLHRRISVGELACRIF